MADDDRQYCLRWNNHQTTLISVFDTLFQNENLVDCTLAAEGRIMKAHKVVLSACSPYFATLLQEQYDKHPIFILKDVKFQELRAMMDYMYRGEVNISQDQLAALLKAAESLQIKGLSDNRTGGGSGGGGGSSNARAEQQQQPQQQHHHRGLNVPGSSKIGGGYTIETQSKRARVGAGVVGPMDTQDMSASREGSSSPSRRRRKVRRRSIENAMGEPHDNSNSSQQQQQQQQQPQSSLLQSNVNLAAAAVASALASQLPTNAGGNNISAAATQLAAQQQLQQQQQNQQMTSTTSSSSSGGGGGVTKKTENVKGTSDAMNTENVQVSATTSDSNVEGMEAQQQSTSHAKIEKQNHKQKIGVVGGLNRDDNAAEPVIEPKSEYDDDGNDETCEDLTLDDMGMDDLDQNAGTSQGGEGSSQGYAWPHERSQDELLLSTQEAQQRDPQATNFKYKFEATMVIGNENNMPPLDLIKHDYEQAILNGGVSGSGSGSGDQFGGNTERFPCAVCGKSYLRKRHLQRHMRDECIGIPPRFSCDMCPSRFRRKYHMVRHLISKHGIPSNIAQQTTGSSNNNSSSTRVGCTKTTDNASISSNGSQHGCDSPIPENLSMRKDEIKCENLIMKGDAAAANAGAAVSLYAVNNGGAGGVGCGMRASPVPGTAAVVGENALNVAAAAAAAMGAVGGVQMPPTYGLTGAITAISAAAAVIEEQAAAAAAAAAAQQQQQQQQQLQKSTLPSNVDANGDVDVDDGGAANAAADNEVGAAFNIKSEPLTPNKAVNMLDDDWKMKLSLQLISNSLLKERLMNTMPFAYNNN